MSSNIDEVEEEKLLELKKVLWTVIDGILQTL